MHKKTNEMTGVGVMLELYLASKNLKGKKKPDKSFDLHQKNKI